MSKKKNWFLGAIGIAGITLAGMECINRLLFQIAVKQAEFPAEENIHPWKKGSFYFEKRENQNKENQKKENQNGDKSCHSPILILHDLYPDQSSDSCSHLADQLSKKRTVYLMDLLGCGRSDKPAITYINYLYVLQVMEMIDQVIKTPVHLVACGRSAAIAVAAAHNQPEKFTQLTLVDPMTTEGKKMPDQVSRLVKTVIELPVIGPFLYNVRFKVNQNAHLGGMNARYLFASILGRYTDWDTEWMLKGLKTPIHVILTAEEDKAEAEEKKA